MQVLRQGAYKVDAGSPHYASKRASTEVAQPVVHDDHTCPLQKAAASFACLSGELAVPSECLLESCQLSAQPGQDG